MKRQIIKIDEEKCTGCGECVTACHEGAIQMIDGKAKLVRDDYCDGLGNCLPACPTGAITFEEREALPYDEAAVLAAKRASGQPEGHHGAHPAGHHGAHPAGHHGAHPEGHHGGCPGSRMRQMNRQEVETPQAATPTVMQSQLGQWPCQIKLVPVNAPYFNGAKLLIAADCSAFAYANFHNEFMKGRITIVGCPKLDDVDYSEKLTDIIKFNDIKSITVIRMEVPCCGGIEYAAMQALQASGKFIPWRVVTISVDGQILDD